MKNRTNNKKGFSLAVAVVLCLFLVMVTGTITTLAIYQQKETGAELNTRQAYTSAKSALDLMEELIKSGEIVAPASLSSAYYVLYYDATGTLCWYTAASANDAIEFINNFATTHPNCKLIGDSYIKLTSDGSGNCTVSAFSAVGMYTPNSENFGDLSFGFQSKVEKKIESTTEDITFNDPEPTGSVIPSPSSSKYLMVGMQSNFSLLKSVTGADYLTLKQMKNYDGTLIDIGFLETSKTPLNCHFPLIFNNTIQIDSNPNRCTYQAYDDAIYFLGSYTGSRLDDYKNPTADNVCYFTQNGVYGTELKSKLIVIDNNMVSKTRTGTPSSIVENYSSKGYTYNGSTGVVVYFPKPCTLSVYTENGDRRISEKTYGSTTGGCYYWLPSGQDLFTYNMEFITDTKDGRIAQLGDINLYDAIKGLGDIRGACETDSTKYVNDKSGSPILNETIEILGRDGKFQDGYDGHNNTTGKYINSWSNTSIYCGPSSMPNENAGTYDLYCGNSFNYLWYNAGDMEIKNDVTINLRSANNVLTIGPEQGEVAIKVQLSWGEVWTSVNGSASSYKVGDEFNYVDLSNSSNNNPKAKITDVRTGSNKIVAKGDNSHFKVLPYWYQTAYSITVMSDFVVQLKDGTTYTVKSGVYKTDLPETGIDLLSNEGKTYFEGHSPTDPVRPGSHSSIDWVDGSGKIKDYSSGASELTRDEKLVNFEASSGHLGNVTYKAKKISCDFTGFTAPIEAKGVTLCGDRVEINAPNGIKMGGGLTVQPEKRKATFTYAGGTPEEKDGIYVEIKSDTKIYNSSDNVEFEIKTGKYFFPGKLSVDILDFTEWESCAKTPGTVSSIIVTKTTTVTTSEGAYY